MDGPQRQSQHSKIGTLARWHVGTVYDRRSDWLSESFTSLADKHRCGVPSKVSEAQREQLRLWATAQALIARQLVTKLSQKFDITIHPNTLWVILKQMNFVWKRTRHSLKKRDELIFLATQGGDQGQVGRG